MEHSLLRPGDATIQDLLAGAKEGWRRDADGRKVRAVLDPCWLVVHFRRVGAEYNWLRRGSSWLTVQRSFVLPLLWLALRERGWLISRQAAQDAWDLASFTPLPSGGGGGDETF